jgi:hypothetical protein
MMDALYSIPFGSFLHGWWGVMVGGRFGIFDIAKVRVDGFETATPVG